MHRSLLPRHSVLLIPTLAACYAPHDPIIVSDSNGDASESSADPTMGPGTDPTMGSTTEPTGSTDPTASTMSSTTDTADSSTSDTNPSGSTDDGGPLCGNMMPDGDEACDDGNDINGDGCNVDCIVSGTELWVTDVSAGYSVADSARVGVDADDNSYVLFTQVSVDFLYSGVIREVDAAGNIVATTEVNNPNPELRLLAGDIAVAADGAAVVTGSLDYTSAGDHQGFVFGYDAAGTLDWSRVIDPGTTAITRGAEFDDDGNLAFVGSQGFNPNVDGLVGLYDALGNELWSEVYDVAAIASFSAVDARADEVFVVGHTGESPSDMWLRKYTANGVAVWTQTQDQAMGGSDYAYGVAADSAGNVFVAGTVVPSAQDADGWIGKYSPDGDIVWQHAINGGADDSDYAYDVAVDPSDNVIVVGMQTTIAGGQDAFVAKYDNDGMALWSNIWDASGGEDLGFGVATTSEGDVVVASYESDDGAAVIRARRFAQ